MPKEIRRESSVTWEDIQAALDAAELPVAILDQGAVPDAGTGVAPGEYILTSCGPDSAPYTVPGEVAVAFFTSVANGPTFESPENWINLGDATPSGRLAVKAQIRVPSALGGISAGNYRLFALGSSDVLCTLLFPSPTTFAIALGRVNDSGDTARTLGDYYAANETTSLGATNPWGSEPRDDAAEYEVRIDTETLSGGKLWARFYKNGTHAFSREIGGAADVLDGTVKLQYFRRQAGDQLPPAGIEFGYIEAYRDGVLITGSRVEADPDLAAVNGHPWKVAGSGNAV